MAFQRDSIWTAVKIRGKRYGTDAEKWHTGKRRNPQLQKRPVSQMSSSPHVPAVERTHRKSKNTAVPQLSPLEELPPEVLQQIFEYSANLDLPLVSRQLESKLSNCQHLQHQLTSELLSPIFGRSGEDVAPASLTGASRLLNSRFVTWSFFTSWLRSSALTLVEVTKTFDECQGDMDASRLWLALRPSPALLPPRKLISPPFTQDKTDFLALLAQNVEDAAGINPAYAELAGVGLTAAVEQGQMHMVSLILAMGVHVNIELVRIAVIESGCEQEIVGTLINNIKSRSDLLDPALWAWAEKAHKKGDEKGDWLLQRLRSANYSKEDT